MTAVWSRARPKISASFPSLGAELWEGCSQTVSQLLYKVHGNIGKGAEDFLIAKSNTITYILFSFVIYLKGLKEASSKKIKIK